MIWDNRCSYHKAAGDYPPEEDRIHWRVSIKDRADGGDGAMTIDARMLTLEQDGIPGYAARPSGPGPHPGILMAHHAHGVTADYKIDAYRLAALGFNVLAPSLFNMFGVPGTNQIGDGADLQAKHSDGEFLGKLTEAWHYLVERHGLGPGADGGDRALHGRAAAHSVRGR